ncbi:MAG: hypothetical protein JO025_15380 [Verrucomicrobia bacterium]|nr:hypothetical protein [Verrucomicrobiota bacterium]
MQFETPILFLIFNRPQLTARVFGAIRESRPAKLYVAADGPRPEKAGEWKLCAETRTVLDQIDWDCDVKTLLRDENLGCGRAVSQAITWFFQQEEEGIILEDDCLPDATFFPFCREMLSRFRDSQEVASISGDNFFPPSLHSNQPYHFSKYAQIWGWASWRHFWNLYDFHLKGDLSEWEEIIEKVNPIENHARYWIQVFKAMRSGLIDTWDYQVMFSAWRNGLVHIYPSKNLIVNLGYGAEATHTRFASPLTEHESTGLEGFEVTLPIEVDAKLDHTTFYFRFLESLTSIWWLEAAIDPTQHIGWARWQSSQTQAELARLKALTEKQAATIADIIEIRSREIFKARIRLLLAHFVFTVRQAIELARTRFNQLLRPFRPSRPQLPAGGDKEKTGKAREKSAAL